MSRVSQEQAAQAAAAATQESKKKQYNISDEERQARSDRMKAMHAAKREAAEPEAKTEKNDAPREIRVPRGNIHRAAALDDIRKSRGEKEPDEQKEEPKAEAPKAEPELVAAAPDQAVSADPPQSATVQEAAAPEMVKVKIDGEELEAPKTEVEAAGGVAAYQIQKASDKRLKAANEALAEARRREQAILELAQRFQPPKQEEKPVTDDEFIQQKMDVIRFGTPQEGAAALRDILGRNRVDPNAITQQAVGTMMHQLAVQKFDTDFADVWKLPLGPELVMALRQKGLQEAQQKQQPILDWNNFYANIGTQVRNALGRPHQPASVATAPAATGTTSLSDKEAKKAASASIVALPTAAQRASVPEEPKPETREQSLARMKAERERKRGAA